MRVCVTIGEIGFSLGTFTNEARLKKLSFDKFMAQMCERWLLHNHANEIRVAIAHCNMTDDDKFYDWVKKT